MDEIPLRDAMEKAEAAFAQAAPQALKTEDPQEQVALWRELAHTYDKTLAWWPREQPSFGRLLTLRDWARQLSTPARGRTHKTPLRAS